MRLLVAGEFSTGEDVEGGLVSRGRFDDAGLGVGGAGDCAESMTCTEAVSDSLLFCFLFFLVEAVAGMGTATGEVEASDARLLPLLRDNAGAGVAANGDFDEDATGCAACTRISNDAPSPWAATAEARALRPSKSNSEMHQ